MAVRWAERLGGALLQAVVVLPAMIALVPLSAAASFGPEALARGEHLRWIGLTQQQCAGCAMCGMSRALSALVHGDLLAAWQYHPGVFVTGPLLVTVVVTSFWGLRRIRRDPPRFISDRVAEQTHAQETARA